MNCDSCLAQAHRLHYTKFGKLCDDCLAELNDPELTPNTTRQISTLPLEPGDADPRQDMHR